MSYASPTITNPVWASHWMPLVSFWFLLILFGSFWHCFLGGFWKASQKIIQPSSKQPSKIPSIGEPFSVCLSHATGQLFGSPAVEGANMCQPCWNLMQAPMALYHCFLWFSVNLSEQQVRCSMSHLVTLSIPINPYISLSYLFNTLLDTTGPPVSVPRLL